MQRIRELRNLKGVSQARLAVEAGMDPATLNRIEQGKGNPNLKTLEKLADALGVSLAGLLEDDSPKGGRRSSLEPSFYDALVEERPLRYLRVPQLFAAKQTKLWAARVERVDFGEEEFRKGVDAFLDFEGAFVEGVGTDLLAALREDRGALPKAEREALDAAKASIDAWYRKLWEASEMLKDAAAAQDAEAQDHSNVSYLDAHRERLKQGARGEFARGVEADDGANVS